jgi:hypothetical protein
MKLLQEASLDDKFNVQMGKIQDAIEKLGMIADDLIDSDTTKPVMSQVRMVEVASKDLQHLAEKLQAGQRVRK